MDELHAFCVRMLGPGDAARGAQQSARDAGDGDRIRELAAAAAACRGHDGALTAIGELPVVGEPPATGEPSLAATGVPSLAVTGEPSLAVTVAGEIARASARLPERQREALALRELLSLSYEEIARIVGMEPVAVGPLLARARVGLRTELRGEGAGASACDERERALRTLAARQDAEGVSEPDEDWLIEHLGHCVGCARLHAAMLEASACYRAWRPSADPAPAP